METTLTLHRRFGRAIHNPTLSDLRQVADEVIETGNLSEADRREHPNCWLEFGYPSGDSWSILTADAYENGTFLLTKYADQDDASPEFQYRLENVSKQQIVDAWLMLAAGRIDQLIKDFQPSNTGDEKPE